MALPTNQNVVCFRQANDPIIGFDLTDTAECSVDGWVIRRGKVFECGEYPDKKFSLTEAEADLAINQYKPVENDHEHLEVTGFLGLTIRKLEKVWREGTSIFGHVSIPVWLDQVLKEKKLPLKVSLMWHRLCSTL